MVNPKILWQICDGKRGHENQSAGLIHALSREIPVKPIRLELSQHKASWWQALRGVFPFDKSTPEPDLIIAAGSQTHATLIAAGRSTGAPTILIMAPPHGFTSFFDLCIVPAHDKRKGANLIETTGAMNLIDPKQHVITQNGLFLIGGPSRHHGWDSNSLAQQISHILQANPEINWTLTNSRRTPSETMESLNQQFSKKARIVSVENTGTEWLPIKLATSCHVWVSEDSVSMIYEALSSGAKVGVLPVPRKIASSRVIKGVDLLIKEARVLPYSPENSDLSSFKAPAPLNEASRVAQIVAQKFFNHSSSRL